MRTTRTAIAMLTAAGLVFGVTSGAVANTRKFADRLNDAPHRADIHSVKVDNSTTARNKLKVLVRTDRFTAPPPAFPACLNPFIDVRGPNAGPEYKFVFCQDNILRRVKNWRDNGNIVSQNCGYRASIDPAAGRNRFVIPRKCLNGPGRVRVAVRSTGQNGDWAKARRTFYGWVRR